MRISKELIAKYHEGKCSTEEQALVEQWLLTDEEQLDIPFGTQEKQDLQAAIWQELKKDTIDKSGARLQGTRPEKRIRYYSIAAAAVALLFMAAAWLFQQASDRSDLTHAPAFAAEIGNYVDDLNREDISFVLGEGSRASFDDEREILDFCGVVKLRANKKMKLAFATGCEAGEKNRKEVLVDKGVTYFALDIGAHDQEAFLVMREDNLNELPPLLRNSLRAQFGI